MAGINIDFIVKNADAIKNLVEFRKHYEDINKSVVQGAANFGRSSRQQEQFIQEEIASLNRKRQVIQQIIDLSKENERLLQREADLQRRMDSGSISRGNFERQYKGAQIDREIVLNKLGDLNGNPLSPSEIRNSERQADLLEEVSETLSDLLEEAKGGARGILSNDPQEVRRAIRELRESGDPADLLTANLAESRLGRATGASRREDVFESVLGVRNFQTFVNSFMKLAQSRNGFDALPQIGQMGGQAIGGIIDKLTGSGTNLWSAVMGTLGEAGMAAYNMHQIPLDEYNQRLLRFRAITGRGSPTLSSQSGIGFSLHEYGDLVNQFALSGAGLSNPVEQARRAMMLQRGFGIEQSTSLGLSQLMRSGGAGDRDLYNLIGGALEAGAENIFRHDRSFLNEFMSQNFSTMQREFVKMQGEVSSGTTMGMFNAFERVGGQFSARHQNSMGNIMSIHQALVNPQSDNMQALSFMALRRANPGMGLADLMVEQQKGVSSPQYVRNMLEMIRQTGGTEDMIRLNLAGAFGLSASAAKELFNNMDAFMNGTRDLGELKTTKGSEIEQLAQAFTSTMQEDSARITDGMIESFSRGAEEISRAVTSAIFNGLREVDVTIINSEGQRVRLSGGGIKENFTKGRSGLPLMNFVPMPGDFTWSIGAGIFKGLTQK